jgi:hypothetical protein
VLGGDDQEHREHGEDGLPVKFRGGKGGHLKKPGGGDGGEIDHAHGRGCAVAADHRDEKRNDAEKAAEEQGAEDGHAEGHGKDDDLLGVGEIRAEVSAADG